jgi:hypothetical protein
VSLGGQPGFGGGGGADVEDDDRVEHETEGRGPAELGLEVPVREPSLTPEADRPGRRVQRERA